MKHTAETYSNINPAVFCGGAAVADYYGADNNNYVAGEGFCCGDNNLKTKSIADDSPNYEKLQYYYHSDHLGSASYITNLDGEVVQHIEYVPFGEVFLEERNNTWNTPFLFNGKELDEETGLYYYGARYYNPRISLWYGVDPLTEKYPNESPYCYVGNNPIAFVDPDGMKKLIYSAKIGLTTGKVGFKATVFGIGIAVDIDLGSTGRFYAVYLEIDDESGSIKVGGRYEVVNTEAGLTEVVLGHINGSEKAYNVETSEINTIDGVVPTQKKEVEESSGGLGPISTVDKRVNNESSTEVKISSKIEVKANALMIGFEADVTQEIID